MKEIRHWQKINFFLVLFDILAINISHVLALLLRFDFSFESIPTSYFQIYFKSAIPLTIFGIFIFSIFKLYKSVWRFVGLTEIFNVLIVNIIILIFNYIFTSILYGRMPISYYLIGAIFQLIFIATIRVSYRVYISISRRYDSSKKVERVIIIGAGEAGRLIFNDTKTYRDKKYKVVGFIDDNVNKHGRYIHNLPILGGKDTLIENVEKYDIDTLFIAIPSASAKERQEIVNFANQTSAKLKIIPSLPELISGDKISLSSLKDVQIEDLLEREPIKVNSKKTLENIKNKVVLVTGGGGSIGSELCRQIASNNPKQLIILDIYENSAYEIEQELKRKYPRLNLVTLIGSVREVLRLDDIFHEYRPDIVYHAAAHKHVPLMETSPNEAVKNNVFGTFNTAFAALRYKVDKFILISTDKAVNPTNIMGATKRICEMIIQTLDMISKTKNIEFLPNFELKEGKELRPYDTNFITDFVAVRFGNVLGSNGSVIPLFKKQIEEGGPITVTHKDIIRYFMTISEAVGLVIEAGFNARGGEIFVLDMGEPVKIDTLARNLIKLSGLKPDIDIEIKYSGLRPGEKLYEEKLMDEEGLEKTENELIHIAKPIEINSERFYQNIKELRVNSRINNTQKVISLIKEIVDTYHSSEEDIKLNKDKFEGLYKESK